MENRNYRDLSEVDRSLWREEFEASSKEPLVAQAELRVMAAEVASVLEPEPCEPCRAPGHRPWDIGTEKEPFTNEEFKMLWQACGPNMVSNVARKEV